MTDDRIELRRPWLAGVLAFLVPGLGHLYQRRTFKGVLYATCIIGLFCYGMQLADWKAMYWSRAPGQNRMLTFAGQFGMGLPSMLALLQNKRFQSEANAPGMILTQPVEMPFEGIADYDTVDGRMEEKVTGHIVLKPVESVYGEMRVAGRFVGRSDAGEPVDVRLYENVELGRPIGGDDRRSLAGEIVEEQDGEQEKLGTLRGSVPRSFWDWFVVPLTGVEENQLHGRLGKRHELAQLFTCIAGLLNLLAIWDALEGPAYGYGDEDELDPASVDTTEPVVAA